MGGYFRCGQKFYHTENSRKQQGEGTRCPPLRFLVRFVMYLDYLLKLEQWIYLQFQLLTQTEVLHHATPLRGSFISSTTPT